jgi:hypothetical protein
MRAERALSRGAWVNGTVIRTADDSIDADLYACLRTDAIRHGDCPNQAFIAVSAA